MRVSYICHETKVCAPHLIYQTEKNLGNNECSAQMQTYLPIQLYTFLSSHCTITRVGVFVCHVGGSDCGYITTIKIRHCVDMLLFSQCMIITYTVVLYNTTAVAMSNLS